MPLTSPGNDDDTGENHQPTLRKNTAEPVEQTLKQNTDYQSGWDAFAAALANAQQVLQSSADQQEVDGELSAQRTEGSSLVLHKK